MAKKKRAKKAIGPPPTSDEAANDDAPDGIEAVEDEMSPAAAPRVTGSFGIQEQPAGHLYFWIERAPIPQDQLRLQMNLELTASVLRETFGIGNERFKKYFWQLPMIAQVGLVGDEVNVGIAETALQNLQNEVVRNESADIKNRAMRKLGAACIGFSLAYAVLAALVQILALAYDIGTSVANQLSLFLVFLAASVVGQWTSFGIRKPHLTFEELQVPEEHRMRPVIRVTFVSILTAAFGLLFLSTAVQFKLGDLSTDQITTTWYASLLFGFFCGLSDQLLGERVSQQASQMFADDNS